MNIKTKLFDDIRVVTPKPVKTYWTEINGLKLETENPNSVLSIHQGDRFLHVSVNYFPKGIFTPEILKLMEDFLRAVKEMIANEDNETKWTS